MDATTATLVTAKTATAVLGLLITGLAYRAYRRAGGPALRALAVGFALFTLGAVLGGTLHLVVGLPLLTATTVQAACTAVGFAVLVHSLYVESTAGDRRDRPGGVAPPGDD